MVTQGGGRGVERFDVGRLRSHRAEHGVGMADEILGRRLNRNIDAVFERFEEISGAPSVIHDDFYTGVLGGGGNRRNIRHLECVGAGRLDVNGFGV